MNRSFSIKLLNIILTVLTVMLCCLILILNFKNFLILFASLYLLTISIIDSRISKIPNKVTLPFFILGTCLNIAILGVNGLLFSLSGLGLGLLLMIIPFVFGVMGAGDVKALATVGAFMGPKGVLNIFLYMGIIGGIIGITYFLFSGEFQNFISCWSQRLKEFFFFRDLKVLKPVYKENFFKFPYAIAIALGFATFVLHGSIFQR